MTAKKGSHKSPLAFTVNVSEVFRTHQTELLLGMLMYFYFLPIVVILAVVVFQRFHWTPQTQQRLGITVVTMLQFYLLYFVGVFSYKLSWHQHSSRWDTFMPTIDSYHYCATVAVEFYDFILITIDSLNTPLIFLNILLTSLACYYAVFSSETFKRAQVSVISLLVSMFLMNILFTTVNLGVFYVAFELLMLPLFFLIGQGTRLRRLRASYLFLMYTAFFSYIMLAGLIYIWVWFGTLSYPKIYFLFCTFTAVKTPLIVFWVLLLIAFLAKVPVLPFHIWLPEAHVEATAVGSVILAGLILKIGVYGIFRFLAPLNSFFPAEWLFSIISILCLISSVYATLMTLVQVDIKRIIAYSSVSHLSFALAGVFTSSKIGFFGAYYYNIGHGFVSSALFFLAGMLYARYGTRLLKYYSGLAALPVLSALLLFFSFANISFPGTVNFAAEFLLIISFIKVNSFFILPLIFIIFFASLVFSLWTYLRVSSGSITTDTLLTHYDLHPYEIIVLTILAMLTLMYGLFPESLFTHYFKIC